MGCQELLDALLHQDDDACAPLNAEQRIKLAVDEAHAAFTDKRIGGLARRARLRYPQADLRTLDLLDERGISRELIASLSDCSWVTRHRNIVAQGYCGSGKSWIVCALARQACRNRYRSRYIRVPDLEEEWRQAADKPQGRSRLLKRYSAYTVLAPGRMAVRPARGTPSAASCSSSWNADTTPAAPCSPPNTPKRTGTNDSEAAPTPTPSWTGSCTTPPG